MLLADPVQVVETNGCTVVLRRVFGPLARELFIACRPPSLVSDASDQAGAVYSALVDVLVDEGADFSQVVSESIFLRDIQDTLGPIRQARHRALERVQQHSIEPATLEIGQTPVDDGVCLETTLQLVIPHTDSSNSPATVKPLNGAPARALQIQLGDETRLYAGGLCGAGDSAYEQTLAMFALAEQLLQEAGMAFNDVVRAWIHLRDMAGDYEQLNRARRVFFSERGIDPVPASTGICGTPWSDEHDLCLGIYAVKGPQAPQRTVMTSPTLNEAGEYGADFVRGMKMVEANKVALHVSGTASIDERGQTAHVGDFESQADRMLLNVASLLEGQGASFKDVVSAITYLKNPEDAPRLREKFREAGYEGFPNILVHAGVCRPDLLCETEALAVLARE